MGDFSHLSARGEAAMVDTTAKTATVRRARVEGEVQVNSACMERLTEGALLEITRTARIAGIQAAKQTWALVPLCHQIPLNGVDLAIELDRAGRRFTISSTVRTTSGTGVEMEAMCAASLAAVTIYDMIKAIDPGAHLGPFRLMEKEGGKSGRWTPEESTL